MPAEFELPIQARKSSNNFFQSTTTMQSRDEEQFTMVLLTYKRTKSLHGFLNMSIPFPRVSKVYILYGVYNSRSVAITFVLDCCHLE